jgi:hypothetical protein
LSKEPRSRSFRGIIRDDRVLKISDRKGMDDFLDTLNGEVEITITEVVSRSHFQNKYYWKVVIGTLLEDEQFGGYTKYDLHDTLKDYFKVTSTSKLSKLEFHEYIEQIIRWAAMDCNIKIPDPNED